MLRYIILSSEAGESLLAWIEVCAWVIEILAVVIIVVAIFTSMAFYLWHRRGGSEVEDPYSQLKISLGKSLLLGLEILVAADIVRTVALEATLESVIVLGLLVAIRTFLSWALVVEIEGRWPWQIGTKQ
ncbi:MAG: DUF1622 domain-containing protein [Chloroflexota bacterium]|jgi:uncharacterized membrane protein